MTPEQLLAKQAGASAAAEALARMAKAKSADKVLEERRQMDADRLAHDEKVGQQLVDLANKAVDKQTTVVPPAPVTNMQH